MCKRVINKMLRIGVALFATALACAVRAETFTPKDIYAQMLVNQTVQKYPDLRVVAIHVTPPGESDNVIIASNIGRIGKRADAEDLHVLKTGETLAKVNKNGDRFEVELPLNDASGNPIGALAIVFPYKVGDKASDFKTRASQIRDELAREIPGVAKLMEPSR
jgi:hypothetical protein